MREITHSPSSLATEGTEEVQPSYSSGVDTQQWLRRLDEQFPRVRLAYLPTPLEYLENLTKHLNGPRIYLKRDDLTGLALGGDKPRKLEYLLGDALKRGADTVLTAGAAQSNHVRLTAAAARKVGLAPIGFVTDRKTPNTGNLLLDRVLGVDLRVHKVANDDHYQLVPLMEQEAERLRVQGRKPYVIPISGTTPLACLGYVRCAFELEEQFSQLSINPTALYLAHGTGGNTAALTIGFSIIGRRLPIVGISVSKNKAEATDLARRWLKETSQLLGVEARAEFEVDDNFIGPGYGEMTDACKKAIELAARTDGILVDPVYTGKALSGLIAHIRQVRLTKKDTVVMIHTGGIPALFAYADELTGIPIS